MESKQNNNAETESKKMKTLKKQTILLNSQKRDYMATAGKKITATIKNIITVDEIFEDGTYTTKGVTYKVGRIKDGCNWSLNSSYYWNSQTKKIEREEI